MCDSVFTAGGPDITTGNYATLMNTPGVGDPVPFSNSNLGSGDLFGSNNSSSKRKKKTASVNNPLSPRPYIVKL